MLDVIELITRPKLGLFLILFHIISTSTKHIMENLMNKPQTHQAINALLAVKNTVEARNHSRITSRQDLLMDLADVLDYGVGGSDLCYHCLSYYLLKDTDFGLSDFCDTVIDDFCAIANGKPSFFATLARACKQDFYYNDFIDYLDGDVFEEWVNFHAYLMSEIACYADEHHILEPFKAVA